MPNQVIDVTRKMVETTIAGDVFHAPLTGLKKPESGPVRGYFGR
jgi:hypothetical protein